jgi:hypothetical protein
MRRPKTRWCQANPKPNAILPHKQGETRTHPLQAIGNPEKPLLNILRSNHLNKAYTSKMVPVTSRLLPVGSQPDAFNAGFSVSFYPLQNRRDGEKTVSFPAA